MQLNKSTHFEISERKILLRVIDIVVACFAIYLASQYGELSYLKNTANFTQWFIVISLYFLFFGTIFEMYDLQKAESKHEIFKSIVLTVSLTVLFFLLTPVFTPSLPGNRFQILYFFGTLLTCISIWRFAYVILIAAPRFYKRVIVVGENYDLNKIIEDLSKKDPNYEIVGFVDANPKGHINSKCRKIELKEFHKAVNDLKISEIVVANSLHGVSLDLYQQLIPVLKKGYPIKSYAHVYEDLTGKIPVENVKSDFDCYFPFSRSNTNKLYLSISRLTDILISLIGLSILVVIIPFVLIFNLIANPGPLFYFQERVGRNGKKFKIIKLRSMIIDAETAGAQWATKDDIRITKFGKILRRFRLDEIPQFINVLKSDMSFIGPRPERPVFVDELSKKIPFYEIRHVVKPGLTGWAQVNARYASTEEEALEKLQYDLYYIKRRNVFLDLRIFLKTVSTIIYYRGQ
jgi:exopolysaccharide biosynthesis polyprenyl glycosylphosphotransferase